MKRSVALATGLTLFGIVAAAACGNSVSDTNSGGSGGSSSSATTSSGGGTGGTIGTGGSPGTGGTIGTGGGSGGGDACTKACSHALGCGEDLCSNFPLDCSTQQGQCLAGCVNGASCQDIMDAVGMQGPVIACALGCLQGGTGGGGQGGNGAGGGGTQACLQCAQNSSCAQLGIQCYMDMTAGGCGEWLNCIQGCSDATCAGACDLQFPNAQTNYQPLYACLCSNCSSECAVADPCGPHPPTGTGGGGMGASGTGTATTGTGP